MGRKNVKDPFYQYRLNLKGIFIATKTPLSTKVLAKALDYKSLEEELQKKGLSEKPIAIQYLEPKEAICAYQRQARVILSKKNVKNKS